MRFLLSVCIYTMPEALQLQVKTSTKFGIDIFTMVEDQRNLDDLIYRLIENDMLIVLMTAKFMKLPADQW